MEQRISDSQSFTKRMWPGGDSSMPFISFPSVEEIPVTKRHSTRSRNTQGPKLKLRHSSHKVSSSRKQRRISSYFARSSAPNRQHEQILGILNDLSTNYSELLQQYKSLHQLLMRRKRRSLRKRSSFHTLLPYSKTCTRSDKGVQTNPSNLHSEAGATADVSTNSSMLYYTSISKVGMLSFVFHVLILAFLLRNSVKLTFPLRRLMMLPL